MARLIRASTVLAVLLAPPFSALSQSREVRAQYDDESGLISATVQSETDVKIVTTDGIAGRTCEVLSGPNAQFPAMVLPTTGALGLRELHDGVIRGMIALREAAQAAGANAVLGLRMSPFMTREENPRMFVYGTLAKCE